MWVILHKYWKTFFYYILKHEQYKVYEVGPTVFCQQMWIKKNHSFELSRRVLWMEFVRKVEQNSWEYDMSM